MYDRVIWPQNYDPKTSAIYPLLPPDIVQRQLVHVRTQPFSIS